MNDWLNIPVKTRIELLREYKKQGYTYSTAKNDFENSYKAYQNGGEITKSNPVIYNNIQPQEVPSSTRVSTKNPQFELELLNRNLLKQDLLQKSSQGDIEAELQFRDVFGTSTHRYRYDNDHNYKQQVDRELKSWKGDKINYPSDSPFRQDAVPYNMRWMYPQLTDKSQKVMGDFSNEVISSALPIPLVESIGKMPSVFKISDKVDDIIKYYHGGLGDEIKTIDDIDLFRTAIKQNKKGRDYSGFYLYDAVQKEGAATYAKQTGRNLHEFDIAKNSKIKELSNIERVTKEDLQKYIDEGYDMITGIDVRGRKEYILLNKEKVKNMKSIPLK